MNAKKIAGFLMMRPAFTQRNLTSVGLVALFFFAYILMGGKITTDLPEVSKDGAFGSGGVDAVFGTKDTTKNSDERATASEKTTPSEVTKSNPRDILGINQSKEREERGRAALGTRFFSEDEQKAFEDEPLDKDGLVSGVEIKRRKIDWNKKREERMMQKRDNLSDIEERLNIRKRN